MSLLSSNIFPCLVCAAILPFGTLLHQPAPSEVIFKHTAQGDLRLYYFQPPIDKNHGARSATLWIHGGGWTGGTCESFFPMARYTAARGAASFVVEYRLAKTNGTVTVADSVADCKSALRYLRYHAADLGINPQQIAVIGESAGGHLAACVGVLEGFDAATDNWKISARPDALVLYNPLTDFTKSKFLNLFPTSAAADTKTKLARELSPLFFVRSNLPPTICIHGLADTVVSPNNSCDFASAMIQYGNRCELVLLPETPHAFLIPNYKCSEATVVNALVRGDQFLTSLGFLSGEPTLAVSEPPAWIIKRPPAKNSK